jgi:transcriptional regulator with XRE-family HTH domain
MSPRTAFGTRHRRARQATELLLARVAAQVRDARVRRGWSMEELARRAGMSRSAVHAVEHGRPAAIATYVTLALALGLEPVLDLTDVRRRRAPDRPQDPVHAAMGELEAQRFQSLGLRVAIDEPYQHFQFAGRADVVAWHREPPALLHIENRTRFPSIGEVAGAWNAKRQYLGRVLAERWGIRRFASETHVMVALWSSEVLHALRMRPATFRALAPHPADAFEAWWAGDPPERGASSTLVLLDPFARGRQRRMTDLAAALAGARPRMRGYADAAARLDERW